VADLSEEAVVADLADPDALLGGMATTRLVYDLFGYWRTRTDAEPQAW
jgi:hypothetical protein